MGPPWPSGYGVRRILSEGVGGIVGLAESPSGTLVAVKLLRVGSQADPDQALARHRGLQRLTSSPGLLRMLACGLTADRAWLWEELVLASGLDGIPPSAGEGYQPATLRAELVERGRFTTDAVVEMGLVLCAALETLHDAGLVHRDVKTGNLLRVEGQVVLGDYGLTAEPGTPFDFKGTEGYVPTEGTADYAADLFALGKTLYELWTGCDRLEFPTLPRAVLDNADWSRRGALLNTVLLQACSPQVRERFQTAGEFAEALRGVAAGRRGWFSRRGMITVGTAAAASIGVLGFSLFLPRRSPVLVWRQRHRWNYIPTDWVYRAGVVQLDPVRQCVYHLNGQRRDGVQLLLGRLDLATFAYDKRTVDWAVGDPDQFGSFAVLRHPRENTLWIVEEGLGPVWRLHPDTMRVERLPGGELGKDVQDRSFSSEPYWNPVTGRVGVFGGYGWFAVRNWRWEYDPASGRWLNVEANRPGSEPRCRSHAQVMSMRQDERSLLLFGGLGSRSGGQDEREPGLPHFDGRFHRLGDLWRLDLQTGAWTALVPAPGLANPASGRWSCCYLAQAQAVLVSHARGEFDPFGTPVRMWVHRVGRDDRFHPLEQEGDVPDGASPGDLLALPGGRSALVFQKAGVFEVTLEG